jgi:hypothetical protein
LLAYLHAHLPSKTKGMAIGHAFPPPSFFQNSALSLPPILPQSLPALSAELLKLTNDLIVARSVEITGKLRKKYFQIFWPPGAVIHVAQNTCDNSTAAPQFLFRRVQFFSCSLLTRISPGQKETRECLSVRKIAHPHPRTL